MPSKPVAANQPTRRTVEAFLREVGSGHRHYCDAAEYVRLEQEIEDLVDSFKRSAKIVRLKKRADKISRAWRKVRDVREAEITALRRMYQTHGLTPRVIKMFQALAEKLNREKSST